MSTYKLVCPHCQQPMRIRSSKGLHPLMRELYLQCSSEACGWTGSGSMEVTHTLSPAAIPNPTIQLPDAPAALRRKALITRVGEDDQVDMFDVMEEENA